MELENNPYEIAYKNGTNEDTREEFWLKNSKEVTWTKTGKTVLKKSHPNKGFWRWFDDFELNMCYNCIDRHQDQPNKFAIHSYSAYLD